MNLLEAHNVARTMLYIFIGLTGLGYLVNNQILMHLWPVILVTLIIKTLIYLRIIRKI